MTPGEGTGSLHEGFVELAATQPAAAPQPGTQMGVHPGTHLGALHALQSLLYIVVVALFIITFCVQPFRIPSESMEPTLLVGDFLLVNRQTTGMIDAGGMLPSASIHRGQIIVFHYPIDPSLHLVKRVIGLPGDRIRLRGGHVFVDGQALREPYAVYRPSAPDSFRDNFPRLQNADPDIDSRWWIRMRHLVDHGELLVPADSYFVLGDNRNDSEDSRYWGLVPRAAIEGTPLLIYFSLQQDDGAGDAGLPGGNNSSSGVPSGSLSALLNFARWDRTLRLVR